MTLKTIKEILREARYPNPKSTAEYILDKIKGEMDKWFLGKRSGKAKDYKFCKRGVMPYSYIKQIIKGIEG